MIKTSKKCLRYRFSIFLIFDTLKEKRYPSISPQNKETGWFEPEHEYLNFLYDIFCLKLICMFSGCGYDLYLFMYHFRVTCFDWSLSYYYCWSSKTVWSLNCPLIGSRDVMRVNIIIMIILTSLESMRLGKPKALSELKGPYADRILIPQASTGSSIFFDIKWKPIFF